MRLTLPSSRRRPFHVLSTSFPPNLTCNKGKKRKEKTWPFVYCNFRLTHRTNCACITPSWCDHITSHRYRYRYNAHIRTRTAFGTWKGETCRYTWRKEQRQHDFFKIKNQGGMPAHGRHVMYSEWNKAKNSVDAIRKNSQFASSWSSPCTIFLFFQLILLWDWSLLRRAPETSFRLAPILLERGTASASEYLK